MTGVWIDREKECLGSRQMNFEKDRGDVVGSGRRFTSLAVCGPGELETCSGMRSWCVFQAISLTETTRPHNCFLHHLPAVASVNERYPKNKSDAIIALISSNGASFRARP